MHKSINKKAGKSNHKHFSRANSTCRHVILQHLRTRQHLHSSLCDCHPTGPPAHSVQETSRKPKELVGRCRRFPLDISRPCSSLSPTFPWVLLPPQTQAVYCARAFCLQVLNITKKKIITKSLSHNDHLHTQSQILNASHFCKSSCLKKTRFKMLMRNTGPKPSMHSVS